MDPHDLLYLVLPFAFVLLFGVPICFSLGAATLFFLLCTEALPPSMLIQQMYTASASFPLMAIPFFIFAGDLMNETGITLRLVNFFKLFLQRVTGGLALSMVATGTLFAGLTGSAVADTAATIKILAPAMEKEGYPRSFTAALAAATGCLGPIIPPSTMFIIYGATVGVSVGGMFIGGIMPGLLMSGLLMLVVYAIARRSNFARSYEPIRLSVVLVGLKDASLALIMPVIILVGIRGGVFTPTEGGAVAVAYSVLVGVFIYRSLTWEKFFQSAVLCGLASGVIMMIIALAQPFGWIISIGQAPSLVIETLMAWSSNKWLLLVCINLFFFIMGMFLEAVAIILLVGPILAPLAMQLGVAPIHFGIMVCVNICIGMITPPVGVNLFVAAPIAGVSLTEITRSVLPFVGAYLVALTCIVVFPQIVLWLPALLR